MGQALVNRQPVSGSVLGRPPEAGAALRADRPGVESAIFRRIYSPDRPDFFWLLNYNLPLPSHTRLSVLSSVMALLNTEQPSRF